MRKTAIIYAGQLAYDLCPDHIAIRAQIAQIMEFCLEYRIVVLAMYQDKSPATSLNKPGLKRLLRDIERSKVKVDYLILQDWGCISYENIEVGEVVDMLGKMGVDTRTIIDFNIDKVSSMLFKFKTSIIQEVALYKHKKVIYVPLSEELKREYIKLPNP